jgi:hypothetical protein
MSRCVICNEQTKGNNKTCSEKCRFRLVDILSIIVSSRWVNKILLKESVEKQNQMVLEFANRHKYNIDDLKRRLEISYGIKLEKK